MNYYLYKLRFTTAVHFGSSDSALGIQASEDHFRADTLFSALCRTAIQNGSDSEELAGMARDGELLLSDSMPYVESDYFLPKPVMRYESNEDVPPETRKKLKSVRWVPVSVNPDGYDNEIFFGTGYSREQAVISGGENAVPYEVGLYSFADGCGLYFIAALKDDEKGSWFTGLTESLGLSGIGGRVSSGLGKFEIDDMVYLNEPFDEQTELLYRRLENKTSAKQMMLTTALPNEDELQAILDSASYQVIRRGGFVQSDSFNPVPLKKKTQYFLAAGSVVQKRFAGSLYQVGEFGTHPVYRYSVPLFMGVDI